MNDPSALPSLPGVAAPPPFVVLSQLIRGAYASQLVGVAARLGIADLLKSGPRSSEDLALAVEADAVALHRVLRGLVLYGVLAEVEGGRFTLTPTGELLRTDAPLSLADFAIASHEVTLRSLVNLLEAVKSGVSPFEHAYGKSFFEHVMSERELGERFDRVMTSLSGMVADGLSSLYDFSSARRLVDVGGGRGHFLARILEANPELEGVLVELPPVLPQAEAYLEAAGVRARCSLVAADFFDAVPPGGDIYLLSWILHDWDDVRCGRILAACRRAMAGKGRLLVVEQLLPERVEENPAAIAGDLEMLVFLPGRERALAEYRRLLEEGGFAVTRAVPIPSPFGGVLRSIIEATPRP
ncbi:methyltransferase [Sorangium sp. So ce429]